MKLDFMYTFLGRVHGVDMNGRNQAASNPFAFIAGNIRELGYGG